eukprot:11192948-Lingulodinium_polyedra.AAC.1
MAQLRYSARSQSAAGGAQRLRARRLEAVHICPSSIACRWECWRAEASKGLRMYVPYSEVSRHQTRSAHGIEPLDRIPLVHEA